MKARSGVLRGVAFGFLGAALFAIIANAGPSVAQVVKEFVVRLQDQTPGAPQTGHVNVSGTLIAGELKGGGGGLTNLNASHLASGTVPDARLSSNVARLDIGNLFAVGPNQFNGFLGVGRSTKVTSAESFGIGNNAPGFDGMYIRTGATGLPFYGYSLNGAVSAYSYVDGSDGGTWKLNVGGDRIFVTTNGFVGIKRATLVSSAESFGIGNNSAGFDGMYVRTGPTGLPFYGYSLNGATSGYHYVDGQDAGKWKLVLGGALAATISPNGRLGLGTATPQYTLHAAAPSGTAIAVFGTNSSPGSFGHYAQVLGGNESYGIYARDAVGDGYGVYSSGDLVVLGNKSFLIDHPLDPENRYLRHYCTESPTPQNVYSGNVITDASGKAWVTLPEYFAEINVNFKYQLTVVDDHESASFVQVKIGREIRDNRFLIMSSAPHTKVSWRVEADRNDPWVRRHGAAAETDKPAHLRGTYLRPELYGKPDSLAEIHQRLAEAARHNDKSRP
jgi:hypothetical protein